MRTGTEQNVAVMKLNGAQDINKAIFRACFAPEWGVWFQEMHHQLYSYREQAHSYRGDAFQR
jgi:hypothetical protein